jgi:aspartyl-tRNA(Asn)/glutamyl-tRNA(Gln) amidotransferase subunit C
MNHLLKEEPLMALSEKEVRHVAMLSRLHLSDDEVKHYTGQLAKILDHVEQLKKVDTTGIEPMITATASGNVFRPDAPRPSLKREDALFSAPDHDDEYFRVPQVIE